MTVLCSAPYEVGRTLQKRSQIPAAHMLSRCAIQSSGIVAREHCSRANPLCQGQPIVLRSTINRGKRDFTHLNPVRAKFVRPDAALASFRLSSYPLFLSVPSTHPSWLRVDRLPREKSLKQQM